MKFKITPLHSAYDKTTFKCGNKRLDQYIYKQAKQDIKKRLSACFVLIDEEKKVKGYYTLSNAGISKNTLPLELSKKLPPSYENLPATLLGRLAIDESVSGMGFGKLLLMDALKRSHEVSQSEIGSMAVIVDPIDKNAVRFYENYGFIALKDSGKMFLAMRTIRDLFK